MALTAPQRSAGVKCARPGAHLIPAARGDDPFHHVGPPLVSRAGLPVARTLCSHRALILNDFRARKRRSSGGVEGLNNKVKLTMRKSCGFRTFHVAGIALYHALGKLPEPGVNHRFF